MSNLRRHFTGILGGEVPIATPTRDFALVLHAPPEIAQALDDIRRRYDPAFQVGIEPHITVKRPATLGPGEKVEPLREVLRQATTQISAFRVQLRGYGVFRQPNSNVLFVKVEDERPFRELHNQVIAGLGRLYPSGLADQYEADNYHPHLTIGNKLSDLDLMVLEHELSSSSYQLDFSFIYQHLSLLISEYEKPWEAVEDFPFKFNQES